MDEEGVAAVKSKKNRHTKLVNHVVDVVVEGVEMKKNKEKKDGEVDDKDKGAVDGEENNYNGDDATENSLRQKKKKKKEKKEEKNKPSGNGEAESESNVNQGQQGMEKEDVSGVKSNGDVNKNNRHGKVEKKEKKKKGRDGDCLRDKAIDGESVMSSKYGEDSIAENERGNSAEKVKTKKKKKTASNLDADHLPADVSGESEHDRDRRERKKFKKSKYDQSFAQEGNDIQSPEGNKKRKANSQENVPIPSKSNKKVRFSGQVEVFRLPDDSDVQHDEEENVQGQLFPEEGENLVRGRRFTKEEDVTVKEAVYKYIADHGLGEDGLTTVLNSKSTKLKGCWKEIGTAIPYRPYKAVYCRAQVLFRRSDKRTWSKEDIEIIKEHQAEHGNQWKELADELGTHRWHVKDAWRRSKLANRNKGSWSQEEYQRLFNLVNTDLQLKVDEDKHSKHGMLRDNISWTAISDQVSSRNQAACCVKWYHQLTSHMVAQGIWADVDDYRLLGALYSLDANCMEDVDWDNILENRSGDICRRRWNQMVLHIGHHGNKSFSEQVDVLAQRYCPNLIEARDTWDSKPRVP